MYNSIKLGFRWAARSAGLVGLMLSWSAGAPLPTNNDPANQIRFDTQAEADAKRAELIKFIWGDGLPTATPAVTNDVELPPKTDGIDAASVASVDRLDVDVSGWGFRATSYLLHPANTANADRVVIMHQGHAHDLDLGVGATANHLLQNGFSVVVMHMPLFGWNADSKTAVIPDRGTLTYDEHDAMILNTAVNDDGQGFRLFLEPVVQNINHVLATKPKLQDISMIGLSGGGWTTSMMAAIDERIKLSVPVAGSAPLYYRNSDPPSVGDAEQYYAPLFDENVQLDGSGGGIATWLEIYVLGGYGQGRRQIQVSNEFDTCCFSGTFPSSYKSIVADKVTLLGDGKWEHALDSTHKSHVISDHIISSVVNPLLGIANPAPTPSVADPQ